MGFTQSRNKKESFLKLYHSSIKDLESLGLSDRQLQYCLAFFHCLQKQGFILQRNGRYYRKARWKIQKALGIGHSQFFRVLDFLMQKKIIIEQYNTNDELELVFANIFKGSGEKFTMIPMKQDGKGIYRKGFKLQAFIEQCIKDDLLDPSHWNPDQMSFKMNDRTARRHRSFLKRTKMRSIPIKQMFIKTTDSKNQDFSKIKRSEILKSGDFYFYKGMKFTKGKRFSQDSQRKAKERRNFVSSFYLELCPNQPERKKYKSWSPPPGFIQGIKDRGTNSEMIEMDMRSGKTLDEIKFGYNRLSSHNKLQPVVQAFSSALPRAEEPNFNTEQVMLTKVGKLLKQLNAKYGKQK